MKNIKDIHELTALFKDKYPEMETARLDLVSNWSRWAGNCGGYVSLHTKDFLINFKMQNPPRDASFGYEIICPQVIGISTYKESSNIEKHLVEDITSRRNTKFENLTIQEQHWSRTHRPTTSGYRFIRSRSSELFINERTLIDDVKAVIGSQREYDSAIKKLVSISLGRA